MMWVRRALVMIDARGQQTAAQTQSTGTVAMAHPAQHHQLSAHQKLLPKFILEFTVLRAATSQQSSTSAL